LNGVFQCIFKTEVYLTRVWTIYQCICYFVHVLVKHHKFIYCNFKTQPSIVAKTTSGFNSGRTIWQYSHGLLLECLFVPSSTDRWAVWAKGKNGRLGRGETGSRNMAVTPKINFLTLVSYSLIQTVFS